MATPVLEKAGRKDLLKMYHKPGFGVDWDIAFHPEYKDRLYRLRLGRKLLALALIRRRVPGKQLEVERVESYDKRVKGIGTLLFKHLVDMSKSKGLGGRIYVEAAPYSVDFYRKIGMKKIGEKGNLTKLVFDAKGAKRFRRWAIAYLAGKIRKNPVDIEKFEINPIFIINPKSYAFYGYTKKEAERWMKDMKRKGTINLVKNPIFIINPYTEDDLREALGKIRDNPITPESFISDMVGQVATASFGVGMVATILGTMLVNWVTDAKTRIETPLLPAPPFWVTQMIAELKANDPKMTAERILSTINTTWDQKTREDKLEIYEQFKSAKKSVSARNYAESLMKEEAKISSNPLKWERIWNGLDKETRRAVLKKAGISKYKIGKLISCRWHSFLWMKGLPDWVKLKVYDISYNKNPRRLKVYALKEDGVYRVYVTFRHRARKGIEEAKTWLDNSGSNLAREMGSVGRARLGASDGGCYWDFKTAKQANEFGRRLNVVAPPCVIVMLGDEK